MGSTHKIDQGEERTQLQLIDQAGMLNEGCAYSGYYRLSADSRGDYKGQ